MNFLAGFIFGWIVGRILRWLQRDTSPHGLCRMCRRKPRLVYRNECIDCFYHNHRN